jgi:hypothetical protein
MLTVLFRRVKGCYPSSSIYRSGREALKPHLLVPSVRVYAHRARRWPPLVVYGYAYRFVVVGGSSEILNSTTVPLFG